MEPYEKLFSVGFWYIYVQYTADDPDCRFDYIIYNKDFDEVDGGLIGDLDCNWNLMRAAAEIAISEGLSGPMAELDVKAYRDKLTA